MTNGRWDDGNHRTDRHSQSKKEHKVLNRYLDVFLLNLYFAFNFRRGLKQVRESSQTQAWALMYLLIKTMLIFRAYFLLPFIAKPILKVRTQHSATKVLEEVIQNGSTKFSYSDTLAWMIGHRELFNASVTWLAELKITKVLLAHFKLNFGSYRIDNEGSYKSYWRNIYRFLSMPE